jgi:hypothetical protein
VQLLTLGGKRERRTCEHMDLSLFIHYFLLRYVHPSRNNSVFELSFSKFHEGKKGGMDGRPTFRNEKKAVSHVLRNQFHGKL